MLKKVLSIVMLLSAAAVFANSYARIDLDGRNEQIAMKPGKASKGLTLTNPSWMKEKKDFYLIACTGKIITEKWQKFSFSFTPQKDGIVRINFRGQWVKPKGAKENIAVWVAYDNITITGTEAKNCDFEFVTPKNMFDGWEGNPASFVTAPKEAKSGKNYVITWHNSPVTQTLKLKKGQEVTVTFWAKKSEGPVKTEMPEAV